MPDATAKFPTAAAALSDFYGEYPNFPEAVLSGAHNNSVTTITLTATVNTAWATVGAVTIDSEIITYTGKSGATLTGCTRGAFGTSAASHADAAKVGVYLTARAVNQILAEVIAVETALRPVSFEVLAVDRWEWYWAPTFQVESVLTGTGGYSAAASSITTVASLTTGATSGGTSSLRVWANIGVAGALAVGKLRRWSFTLNFLQLDANTNAYFLMTSESVAVSPSLTARHFGLKNVAGVVSFTTADGTTEQTTDVSAFVTANTDRLITITYDATTAKLYVDGTLRASHATNVPDTTVVSGPVFRAYIVNSAAASKTLYVGRQSASFAI